MWHPGLTQSHDLPQMSSTAEGKRSENHVMWHHKQADIGGPLINSNTTSVSRTQTEGSWLSSSHHLSASQHQFQDAAEDSKSVSAAWPALSGYSTLHSSKLNNGDPIIDPNENGKKAETATSCRLFGFELINHSSSTPLGKAHAHPISASSDGNGLLSTLSASDSDQKSDLSKASKEQQQGQSHVSPKEIQSKQNCYSNTRSRTKVLKQTYLLMIEFYYVALVKVANVKIYGVGLEKYCEGPNAGHCCWSGCGLDIIGRV